jgi:hypothetical protein
MALDMLINQEGSCWIRFEGEPDAFDPRKPLNASPMDVPLTAKSRLELRRALRSIALRFLANESEDEDLLNLVTVVVATFASQSISDTAPRWFAKMIGRDGKEADDFLKEFYVRFVKGLELVNSREEYRAVRAHHQDLAARSCVINSYSVCPTDSDAFSSRSGSEDSDEPKPITSQIRDDLDQDPEAIWFTSHPLYPELDITQRCMRVAGPVLDETSNSKFAKRGNKLILVEAFRKVVYQVLDEPHRIGPPHGILLLALTAGSGPRAKRWFIWRTSQDLGLAEEELESSMEMVRGVVAQGKGETGEMVREAIRMLAKQRSIS